MGLKSQVSSKDKAILDLKHQRDKIKQYQKRLELLQAQERDLAKQCLERQQRDKALIYLKKSKHQSQLLGQSYQQLTNIEELISSIEFALVQKDIVNNLAKGAQVLKDLNSEMSLTKVDQIMDDTAEGIAYQQELSDRLSEQLSATDEQEIEDELAKLESEQSTGPEINLPDVPKTNVNIGETSQEEEQQGIAI